MSTSSRNSSQGLLGATLLGLSVASCATSAWAPARAEIGRSGLDVDDVPRLAESALSHYDVALLGALVELELTDLTTSPTLPGGERLRLLARLAHRLADTFKFEATCLPDGEARERVVRARLGLAERSLRWLESGLECEPGDATLTFAVGEMLAFSIDGVLSGLSLGERSQQLLERAVSLGAGADAELALAKRFYYLPSFAGGDLARAEAAVRDVVARHPNHESSHAFLGQVLHARSDRDGARRALERARALNPSNPRARALLADPQLELQP